jgi:F420-dependent oxidoreductase-like protein
MSKALRFGIQTPPQNTSWQEMRQAWKLIDDLGFDTAWTFDHFFPILSDPSGPCFEGWITLAALAAETSRVRVGVLVTGNTYRNPAVLANMGATLDHTSGGRLIMGIGAGWFELEHNALDIPFYTTGERIRRLDEAAQIIKMLWTQKQSTFDGRYYKLTDAYCEPKPVQQPRPPLMIGGSGEKLMLRVIARHADLWNTFGSPELFRHKLGILAEHCQAVGRDINEIEVSWAGTTFITDSAAEKDEAIRKAAAKFGLEPDQVAPGILVGPVEEIRDRMRRFIEAGITHFIFIVEAPFDHNTIRRLAEEVIPSVRG